MGYDHPEKRNRRLAVAFSSTIDALLGATLILFGFGILPVKPLNLEVAPFYSVAFGAVMFFIGAGVAIYNYSRLDE